MQTLLIDNYDSFTFNLYQLLAQVNGVAPIVVRNDAAAWAELCELAFDNIVISPGPGRPEVPRDFGVCAQAILEAQVPVLGVCLGHQGICQLFGGAVETATEVMHGRVSRIHHDGREIFAGIPSPFTAVRYHSLHVAKLGTALDSLAWTEDGVLMAVRHRQRPIWGVQFHPESVCTEFGQQLLENFRALTARHPRWPPQRRHASDSPSLRKLTSLPTQLLDTASIARPRLHDRAFKLYCRRIPAKIDTERAFVTLFAESHPAFWLDSALATDFSRFSYMGDATGPHAELVTYELATRTVQVTRADQTATFNESIFDYLQRRLHERRIPALELPFDFNGGYVGYLGYELKADCGAKAAHRCASPDATFIFADRLIAFDHECGVAYLVCVEEEARAPRAQEWLNETEAKLQNLPPVPPGRRGHPARSVPQTLRHPPEKYLRLIAECQRQIKRGESYEICLTNMIASATQIDPLETYRVLRAQNAAPYAAFLNFPALCILSASPERFLSISPQGRISSKPIKGTRRRGQSAQEDDALREELRTSPKDKAENLMIVDLMRNDLGKICALGSVQVADLFAVETYTTLHQLVSSIQGQLRPGIDAVRAVQAAFPAGSMTGAPKLRTMEIIDQLEDGPRGIYSGALGFFALNGSADLNVIIRTMVMADGQVNIGCGGAIVDLSDPQEEVAEMLLKARAMLETLAKTALPNRSQDGSPHGASGR